MMDFNAQIKSQLQERARKKKRSLAFGHLSKSFKLIFGLGIPTVALFFGTFLAWQAGQYDFTKAAKSASASQIDTNTVAKEKQTQEKLQNAIQQKTEVPREKGLNIQLIKQTYSLSCESASLQMALKYFGLEKTQDEILSEIGYSEPREMIKQGSKIIWGDPDKGFVGKPEGKFTGEFNGETTLKYATGWGVHNGPVAVVAQKYRPGSKAIDNASIEDVKEAIANENPVIWWHRRDDIHKEEITIQTQSGKKIYFSQMHVNLISGYKTASDGSLIFSFKDPQFGEFDLDQETMIRWWNRHDNQIVIVE